MRRTTTIQPKKSTVQGYMNCKKPRPKDVSKVKWNQKLWDWNWFNSMPYENVKVISQRIVLSLSIHQKVANDRILSYLKLSNSRANNVCCHSVVSVPTKLNRLLSTLCKSVLKWKNKMSWESLSKMWNCSKINSKLKNGSTNPINTNELSSKKSHLGISIKLKLLNKHRRCSRSEKRKCEIICMRKSEN